MWDFKIWSFKSWSKCLCSSIKKSGGGSFLIFLSPHYLPFMFLSFPQSPLFEHTPIADWDVGIQADTLGNTARTTLFPCALIYGTWFPMYISIYTTHRHSESSVSSSAHTELQLLCCLLHSDSFTNGCGFSYWQKSVCCLNFTQSLVVCCSISKCNYSLTEPCLISHFLTIKERNSIVMYTFIHPLCTLIRVSAFTHTQNSHAEIVLFMCSHVTSI